MRTKPGTDGTHSVADAGEDSVLAALDQAEAGYRAVRDELIVRRAEGRRAVEETAQAREASRLAAAEADHLREQLAREKKRAARLGVRAGPARIKHVVAGGLPSETRC